jgi:hypothetical protein
MFAERGRVGDVPKSAGDASGGHRAHDYSWAALTCGRTFGADGEASAY